METKFDEILTELVALDDGIFVEIDALRRYAERVRKVEIRKLLGLYGN